MSVELRDVTEADAELLFHWANETEVRQNALNQDEIAWEDHIKWFNRKIKSDQSKIFILEKDKQPVGQIRYDKNGNFWEISFSIGKKFRGSGFGKMIIELSRNRVPGPVRAVVKNGNLASQKVFESLEFEREGKKDDLVQYVYFK